MRRILDFGGMDVAGAYATHQRKTLIEYLKRHGEQPHSVQEIVQGMLAECDPSDVPGTSTAYRLLTKLVEEGAVKQIATSHSRQFLYWIVHDERCHHHLHMRCAVCGRVEHMDEGISERIADTVLGQSAFLVDQDETVLLGECADCLHRRAEEDKT